MYFQGFLIGSLVGKSDVQTIHAKNKSTPLRDTDNNQYTD